MTKDCSQKHRERGKSVKKCKQKIQQRKRHFDKWQQSRRSGERERKSDIKRVGVDGVYGVEE